MNKTLFTIPTRKKPKSARFVIGPGDPNKKQTIPRGFSGGGYAAGLGDTNVVGAPVNGATGGSFGDAGGSAIVASVDTPDPIAVTKPHTETNKPNAPYQYGCIMLAISDALSSWLGEWVKQHIPEAELYVNPDSGIDGYESDHHISMLYGIHGDDPQQLHPHFLNMLDTMPEIQLGDVTCFDANPDFDVINVSVASNLNDIHDYLADNIEHTKVFDTFTPHITLAYAKKGACKHLLGCKDFRGMTDKPNETVFSNRYGEQYRYAFINDKLSDAVMG